MAKSKRKSLKRARSDSDILQEAINYHQSGEIEKARYRYTKILKTDPSNVNAANFYGMLESQHGDLAIAERLLKRSVSLDPLYADALNNLGNCLKIQGKLEEAEDAYRRAHEIKPVDINPMINLGVLARSSGNPEQADHWYAKALSINANSNIALVCLAGLQEARGNYDAALENYQKALKIDETYAPLFVNYGRLLTRLDRREDAADLYKKQLQHNPDDATAQHMLFALSGEHTPDRASDNFVVTLFDRFATSFDQVLDKLEYAAPKLVGDLVTEFYPDAINSLNVLDAGCGTGLCGEYLRPLAQSIIGIDLSGEMLRRAKLCEHYDSLVKAEIIEYLHTSRNKFDLIVSADTFCYFGKMEEVCHAAFAVLNKSGKFIFTVEQHLQDNTDYFLHTHGRYSHSEAYIQRCLKDAGFSVLTNQTVTLRKERSEPVKGILVCAGVE